MQEDAIPQYGIQQGISGPAQVDHVDLDACGLTEIGCEAQPIEVAALDPHVGVRVRTGLAAGARAEEECDPHVLAASQGISKGFDHTGFGVHGASLAPGEKRERLV